MVGDSAPRRPSPRPPSSIAGSLDSPHPARWMAPARAVSPLMIAIALPSQGRTRARRPAGSRCPPITLGMRFERRGVTIGAVYLFVLMGLSVFLARSRRVTRRSDRLLIFTAGLTLAALLLSGPVVSPTAMHRQQLRRRPAPRPAQSRRPRPEGRRPEVAGRPRPRQRLDSACSSATSITSRTSTTSTATPPATPSCATSPTRSPAPFCSFDARLPDRRRGVPGDATRRRRPRRRAGRRAPPPRRSAICSRPGASSSR